MALCGAALAQSPVCPRPIPDRPVHVACAPGGRFAAAAILSNFAIDQTMRGDVGTFQRAPHGIFTSVTSQETQDGNAALGAWLARLAAASFTRLDTATGTLRMDVDEEDRSFTTRMETGETTTDLSLTLPQRVEGGYWRTPGVLQIAFWKGRRVGFKASVAGASELASEVECLTISGDGIRLLLSADEAPDVLVRFDSCP